MLTPAEWSALRVSVVVAGGAVAFALPAGVAMGWFLARGRFPGKTLVEAVVLLPLVLPPVVTGYLLLLALGRGSPVGRLLAEWNLDIAFTLPGMALAGAVVGFPLLVRAVRIAVEGVDPGLEEAARTLGLGPWHTFWTVTLPLARHGLVAGAVLAFARVLGEFGATIMIAPNLPGTRTLALEIFRQTAVPGGEHAVLRLAVISVVVALVSLLLSEFWLARARSRS